MARLNAGNRVRMLVVAAVMAACAGLAVEARAQVVDVGPTSFPGAVISADSVPMNSSPSGNFFTMWTPSQLASTTGTIYEFGFMYRSSFTAKTWSNVKIWLGGTTRTSGISITINAPTPVFLDNFHATAQPVLVYDGSLTLSAATTGLYLRTPLQVPYAWAGGNMNLAVYMEVTGGSATPSSLTASFATSPISPSVINNFRVHNTTTIATSGTLNHSTGHAASFLFGPAANPGIVVKRGTATIADNSTDNVGSVGVVGAMIPVDYVITNPGPTASLNITSIAASNLTNCAVVPVYATPMVVPPLNVPYALMLRITAGSGAFSATITILSNASAVSDQTFVFTVSGTGVANVAPVIQPPSAPPGGSVTGSYPNYTVEALVGGSLDFTVSATDANPLQPMDLTLSAGTGGTLTPLMAGISSTLPVAAANGISPRSVQVTGTASVMGTLVLSATAADNGSPAMTDAVTVTVKIGARVDLNPVVVESPYLRTTGRKDVYRGQLGIPVTVTFANANAFPVSLQTFGLTVVQTGQTTAVTGITLNLPTLPLTIPANSVAFPLAVTMDVAASTPGASPMSCQLRGFTATVIDPAAPATNPVVVVMPTVIDEFDVRNAPIPVPLAITTTSLSSAVEGAPYSSTLEIAGGSGNYTWSVAPGSAAQIPAGLTLDATGTQFLPAKISGIPAVGSSAGSPYAITFNVTDGTHLKTTTLTMTVVFVPPLSIVTGVLPTGMEHVPYAMPVPLTVTGGLPPYTFTVDASSQAPLPAGLSLNAATGVITGSPADGTAGTHQILFSATDGFSSAQKQLALVIAPHPLVWQATTLPPAVATVAYSQALGAIGGTGPRIYSIIAGTLPPGLALNPIGSVSGVPTVTGSFNVTFRVQDSLAATADQAMTMVVDSPAPIVLADQFLPTAEAFALYSHQLTATGGSGVYTFALDAGSGLPPGMTLSPNGLLSGTPAMEAAARIPVGIVVSDGFSSVTRVRNLGILMPGERGVQITEVDVAGGYIEVSNTGLLPASVAGWRLRVWKNGVSPVSMPFDTLPNGVVLGRGNVMTLAFGGTAGGTWPNFFTGVASGAGLQDSVAVQLLDAYWTTVDFMLVGSLVPSLLWDHRNVPLEMDEVIVSAASLTPGSANHSRMSTGWSSTAVGTSGVYNPGLGTKPLAFGKSWLRSARQGESFIDWVVASGGKPPYTYSLQAPQAPWLAVGAATGEVTGTVPAAHPVGTSQVSVTVTDADMASVTHTVTLAVFDAAPTTPGALLTLGSGTMGTAPGTSVSIPVVLSSTMVPPGPVSSFSFAVELPAATAAQAELVRATAGSASAAASTAVTGHLVSPTRMVVTLQNSGTGISMLTGTVANIELRVPPDGPSASPGAYPLTVIHAGVDPITSPMPVTGVSGELQISDFKPQDGNRDGSIDVVDVQLCVNIILAVISPAYPGQCDANGDFAVDVVDVQTIVNCILTGGC